MHGERWQKFCAATQQMASAYGRKMPEGQAERWFDAVSEMRISVVVEAMETLAETSSTYPTLPRLLEACRALQGDGTKCVACGGSGTVFTREAGQEVGVEAWHGKRAVRCRCRIDGGRPLTHDPSLPGNPACVCGGRGWMPYDTTEDIPEGRRYIGAMLTGRVMGECPCRRPESQQEVQRETISAEPEPEPAWDPLSSMSGWVGD